MFDINPKSILFFLLTIIILFSNLISAQNTEYSSFDEVQTKINELEAAENYKGAIEFMDSVREQFPENEFDFFVDLAYCNLKLQNYEVCMNIWEEAHAKGYFFLFMSSPDYNDIMDNERFKSIVQEDNKLRSAALEKSKTIYEVRLPDNYSPSNDYPVMIIFHGGGRNINSPKSQWTAETLKNNFITVYLQSYLHYGSKSFGWAHNDPRVEEDIKIIFSEIVDQYPVDTTKVFIGGISAGGMAAFDIGLINPIIPVKNIIAICPAIAARFFTTDQIMAFKESGKELNIITGENDWGLERQKEVMQMLDEAGVKYNVTIIPGMGHEYPEDFEQRLESILSGN